MKIKEPIPLSTIFQYFADENVLKRPKMDLVEEMKDVAVICSFLLHRIPAVMKSLKQSVREQQKCMKETSQNIKKSMQAVVSTRARQSFYLQSAYKQLSSFPITNFDFTLGYNTKTELEIKLKFFESENLPSDFIWQKPMRPFYTDRRRSKQKQKDKQKEKEKQKDYSWHSFYNNKSNMIQIVTRKYKIFITLDLQNGQYVWVVHRIQLKVNQEPVNWMLWYFYQKVMPVIKEKYEDRLEINFLSCVDKFSYYLQLMELNYGVCQIMSLQNFTEQIAYKHKNTNLQLTFTTPESFSPPSVLIKPQQSNTSSQNQFSHPPLSLQLTFHKRFLRLTLQIPNLLTLQSADNFKYQSVSVLMSCCVCLLEYGKRFINFVNNYRNDGEKSGEQFRKFVFVRLGGVYWAEPGVEVGGVAMSKSIIEDGIYIGFVVSGEQIWCKIGLNGQLHSKMLCKFFLAKLIKQVPSIDVFFKFMYILEAVLRQNKKKQVEMDHYTLITETETNKKKVQIYCKKKNWSQDLIIKTFARAAQTDDDHFNSIKFSAQISTNFEQAQFYTFKDPEAQRTQNDREEWRKYINPKYKEPHTQLDVNKIVEFIMYFQDNLIFRHVIDKKMKSDSRGHYKINV